MSRMLSTFALMLLAFVGVAAGAGSASAQAFTGDIVIGKADAPVTVIEYASLTCPHCATFQINTLPEFKKEYVDTGKVKVVFRDFPLDGVALRAAQIARCGGPDRAAGYIDVIFRQQSQWAAAKDPLVALKQIGKFGGLSDAQMDACLADKGLEDAILKSRLDGQTQFKINSTPTLIIGDKNYPGAGSFADLKKIVDPLIK